MQTNAPSVPRVLVLLALAALLAAGCGSSQHASSTSSRSSTSTTRTLSRGRFAPPPADNVYAYDRAGNLSPAVQRDRALVYVPNSMSNTVTVISQRTLKIVAQFPTGALPQHVTPAYNLKTLYVDNDLGNSLTPINPRTGAPGRPIAVEDPYNLYFTPRRTVRDRRRRALAAARLPRPRDHAPDRLTLGPDVPRRGPHGLLRRRPLRVRKLRVQRADDQGRPTDQASREDADHRQRADQPAGRETLPERTHALHRRPADRRAVGG